MYNSHTTYFVLASIFLSFFCWSSHLQTPSNLLWCFGFFIGEVWCGTTRRDTRRGHAVFSLHSCDVFLFWMEKNIQHQKRLVTGCLKSSEITLLLPGWYWHLTQKVEFQCPTWHGNLLPQECVTCNEGEMSSWVHRVAKSGFVFSHGRFPWNPPKKLMQDGGHWLQNGRK